MVKLVRWEQKMPHRRPIIKTTSRDSKLVIDQNCWEWSSTNPWPEPKSCRSHLTKTCIKFCASSAKRFWVSKWPMGTAFDGGFFEVEFISSYELASLKVLLSLLTKLIDSSSQLSQYRYVLLRSWFVEKIVNTIFKFFIGPQPPFPATWRKVYSLCLLGLLNKSTWKVLTKLIWGCGITFASR